MFWRHRRLPLWLLVVLAIFGLGLITLVELTQKETKQPFFDEKLLAAKKAEQASKVILSHIIQNNLPLDNVS
jgi:hypothetical protein